MMPDQLPLFVFGTLRRGECNHHLLAGRYTRMEPAELPGFRRVHPLMIVRDTDDTVEGELFFLDPARYDETMRRCDDLEGIPPEQTAGEDYRRIKVAVHTEHETVTAWAYVHPRTPEV